MCNVPTCNRDRAPRSRSRNEDAFSLVEVLVAVSIIGVLFVALYSGLTYGYVVIRSARESLRATQILQEKMEVIRLYRWDQVLSNGFIPATFSEPFYTGTNGGGAGGLNYSGTATISTIPLSESYSNDLRQLTVTVRWVSGRVTNNRSMSTFVSRYGLQNYVY